MLALIGTGGRNAHPSTWAPFVVVGEGRVDSFRPFEGRAETKCMVEGMLAEPWHLRGYQEIRLREFLDLVPNR